MTDVETRLRSRLHAELDDLQPSTLTTQHALRAGQRARRRRTVLVAATTALALLAGTATATAVLRGGSDRRESVVAAPTLADRTSTYAEQFRAGDFAGIRADMTPEVRALLSERQLSAAWQMALDTFGPFLRPEPPAVRDADAPSTYLLRLQFRKGDANMRVTYDDQGAVIGITLLSAQVEKLATVPGDLAASSRQLVDDLAHGRYDSVRSRFDAEMTRFLSVAKLRAGWQEAAVREHGGFVAGGGMTATRILGATVVDVFCTMRRGELRVRISYDSQGAVSGLLLQTP
jgi:YD repeat-containing protein